ncbi:MAG: hypothetical protein CL920_17710 [Deltaproteobacteria bacterium]|nr:hypothetical protein [Deltaproteobacteria bacterium]MBU50516.1 hypothetical protein [Deltaproteobacteria bacterium]
MCAKETFAYRGVIMNTPFDCWGLERGKTYTFEGKVADETSALAFNVQFEGGGWQRQCVQVTNRAFKFDFTWPKDRPAGYAYIFMSTGQYRSSGGCSSVKGWNNSLRVWSK